MKLIIFIVSFTLLTLVASSTALSEAEACKIWKNCREKYEKNAKKPAHTYDLAFEEATYDAGEFYCAMDVPCVEERKKFCSQHMNGDPEPELKKICTTWATKGYTVEIGSD